MRSKTDRTTPDPKARSRKPGVVAVARAAGVSASTVSNAFNRPERLTPALRERVLRAAAELGYGGPDPVARSLRSGRAGALGIVFRKSLADAFDDPATARLLRGVSDVTDPQQLAIVLVPGLHDEAPSVTPAVRNAAVDGLIVYSLPGDDPLVTATLRRRVPTVIVDSPAIDDLPATAGTAIDFVGIDDRTAAESAVRHLLDFGHRRLAILSLALSAYAQPGAAGAELQAQATASVPKARLRGCESAVVAAGLDWPAIAVEQSPINNVASGRARAHALLDRVPGLTALFAFSDPLALGARLAARERGLSVPGDLSVVGFDDTAPESEGLTSVHQPLLDKGRIAADRLLSTVTAGSPPSPSEPLPTRLVVRASSGSPP